MKENIPRAPYLAQDERVNPPSCLYALGRFTRSYVCAPATARAAFGIAWKWCCVALNRKPCGRRDGGFKGA